MQNNSTSASSSNSPAAWPGDPYPPAATIAAAIGLVAIYLLSTSVLLRAFHVTQQAVHLAELTLPIIAVQVLSYVPIVAYLAIVLPRLTYRTLGELYGGFGRSQVAAGFIGALVMWFSVIAVGAVQTALSHRPPQQLAVRLFESARPGLLLDVMIGVALVLAPIAEELVFRAFFFNALWRRFPLWAAATVSGLIFGAAHGEIAGVLPLAAGGIVLANVYARTGSLWSSTIAHSLFNAISLLLLLGAGIKT